MKKFLVILMVVAMASFLFVGCMPGVTPPVDDEEEDEEEPVVPATNTPIISAISDGVSITSAATQYVNKTEAADGVTVSGSASEAAVVSLYINDVAIAATANVTVTGTWSLIITKAELGSDEAKTVYAVASEVGLADATSTSYDFTLDTDAPGIKSIACTAKVAGTATAAKTVSGSVTGTNPLSALALSGTTTTVVAGDYKIETLGIQTATDNVKITTPAGETTTSTVVASQALTDVIPGVKITFKASWASGDGVTITNTAAVAAPTAIDGRATITFDEDVSHAGMAKGTYAGGLISVDPTTYKPATDTGYWAGVTATKGDTVTITVYGIEDLAGNPGGTATSLLTKSCTVGTASATLLAP